MAEVKVTLAHKKNIRDAEAQKAARLAKIKAATGVDYDFVLEPKADDFVLAVIKSGNSYHERVGHALYNDDGYLANIAELLTNSCKDDMIKEAVVEATSNKKIVLTLATDKSQNTIEFKDGNLVVYTSPDYVYYGISHIANIDVAKLL